MSEPDRTSPSSVSSSAQAGSHTRRPADRAMLVQILLWTLFAVFLGGNAAASLVGLHLALDAAFGAGALACLAAAIIHHRKTRR
ncbi:hypothetical protein [Streptomonospora arabica]|uniref:DUF5337 domain-containing protein n=1 Tax=Streptomonospora arabica TaxID=412417 RepID=A0ABV9STQ7_9ACTN